MASNNAINNNVGGQNFYAEKTLNPTQMAAAFGAPILFDTIPNPGPNNAIAMRYWGFKVSFNSAAYTGGGAVNLYYDNARTQVATSIITAANMTASASVCANGAGSAAIIPGANAINKPIYISNATAPFATGDSNVTFFAIYSVISFDTFGFPQNCINNQPGNNFFNAAELYIPSAQVQALNGTPLSIVGAPSAGQIIVPEKMTSTLIYKGVPYSTALVSLIPHGGSIALLTSTAGFISGTANQFQTTAVPSLSNYAPSNLSGLGLDVKASANPGVSGNSDLKIYLSYSIVDL